MTEVTQYSSEQVEPDIDIHAALERLYLVRNERYIDAKVNTGDFAFAYERMSTKRQKESISRQKVSIKDMERSYKVPIAWHFADPGKSGKLYEQRPKLQEMLQRFERGEANYLYVEDLSRLWRGTRAFGLIWDRLVRAKINVVCGRLGLVSMNVVAALTAGMSADEIDRFCDYSINTKKIKAAQGLNMSRPPFGVEKKEDAIKGKRFITLYYKKIVKRIFKWYLKGLRLSFIAKCLQRANVPTKIEGGWTAAAVGEIIDNPIYTGYLIFNRRIGNTRKVRPEKDWIRAWVPELEVITLVDFIAAQNKRLAARSNRSSEKNAQANSYLMSSQIKCTCNTTMTIGKSGPGTIAMYCQANPVKCKHSGTKLSYYVVEKFYIDCLKDFFAPEHFNQRYLAEAIVVRDAELKAVRDALQPKVHEEARLKRLIRNAARVAIEAGSLSEEIADQANELKGEVQRVTVDIAGLREVERQLLNRFSDIESLQEKLSKLSRNVPLEITCGDAADFAAELKAIVEKVYFRRTGDGSFTLRLAFKAGLLPREADPVVVTGVLPWAPESLLAYDRYVKKRLDSGDWRLTDDEWAIVKREIPSLGRFRYSSDGDNNRRLFIEALIATCSTGLRTNGLATLLPHEHDARSRYLRFRRDGIPALRRALKIINNPKLGRATGNPGDSLNKYSLKPQEFESARSMMLAAA